jgi:preprotein translocase subunit SecD
MSTAEILAELPKLSREERRRILDRILEMEDDAQAVEAIRRTADVAFQMLDAMEAADAASQSR